MTTAFAASTLPRNNWLDQRSGSADCSTSLHTIATHCHLMQETAAAHLKLIVNGAQALPHLADNLRRGRLPNPDMHSFTTT
jgi:hypothetical protein